MCTGNGVDGGAAGKDSGPEASGGAAGSLEATGQADMEQPSTHSSGGPQPLFALPLYRKPAFPGFYHIVQIADPEILEFLNSMRRTGQGQSLAGFMTLELPKGLSDSDGEVAEPLVTVPPEKASGSEKAASGDGSSGGSTGPATTAQPPRALRRDTGRVNSGEELENIGTLLQIISQTSHPNLPGGQVVVMPIRRLRLVKPLSKPSEGAPLCAVYVESVPDVEIPEDSDSVRALHQENIATMKELLKTSFQYKDQFEQVIKYYNLDNPLKLADLVAGMSSAPRDELQAVLVENRAEERLRKVLMIMKKDLEQARMQSQFKAQMEEKFAKDNRKYVLMQHLRHIKRELNLEKDDKQSIIAGFKEAVAKLDGIPEEVTKVFETEIGRLGHLEPQAPEFNVTRTYLEWLTALPWAKTTEDNKDIEKAEQILNEDHYSLEDVKERILEHMAVGILKGNVQGKIMCLVGPPGVGKTSVGKSVARALDRKFFRFSVGGLHDVAEIRGHRRTYVGAMPGKIIQALKITQVSNPVILIDEVDKLGRDFRGDPTSALLEVMDSSQNNAFRDLYLDVPVDLTRVLFICTANMVDTIPSVLLDRMEVIRIAGYVYEEKLAIANQYLIPQTISANGVTDEHLEIAPGTIEKLIKDYAREAGVRELRKLLEKIARKTALSVVRAGEEKVELNVVSIDNLVKFVGQPPYTSDRMFPDEMPPGTVMGLAWTALGGKTLFVEARGHVATATRIGASPNTRERADEDDSGNDFASERAPRRRSGGAHMKVTGNSGKVMNESSKIALTYAQGFIRELEPPNSFLEEAGIHLNLPEGATPKDGPSAGVTMTSSLLSLALDKPVKPDLAMTGEMTLTGKVLRVGGIKEKALAARREHVGAIVLPMSNHAEYMEIKPHLRAGLTAHFVDHYDDVYRLAFEDAGAPMPSTASRGSPVLTIFTPPEEGLSGALGAEEAEAPTALAALNCKCPSRATL